MIDWLKYQKIYLAFSGVLIAICVFGLAVWGLKLGVDFTGGTLLEYSLPSQPSTENVSNVLTDSGLEVESVQKSESSVYFVRSGQITNDARIAAESTLDIQFGGATELRYEAVGPTIGPELVKKTAYAIAISTTLILLWVGFQFKSLKFGAAAVLAMLHDSFILVGSFSLFGHFFGAEADFLFVTALLTTLSFSVHDTIVVFDRIREITKTSSQSLTDVSNEALSETMVRSLNNSFTICFMLLALLLLGGTTIRWFAAALLVGTILGTYSSPFIAVPLLNIFSKVRMSGKK